MKQINNYIQEKLYIGKGFKTKMIAKYKNWEEFSKYLNSIGVEVNNDGMIASFVYVKETSLRPFMNIYHVGPGFFINSEKDGNAGEVKVCVDDGKMTYVTFDADDYEFDKDPGYKGVRYLYTANNGDILLEILKDAKEKFC